MRSGAHYLTDAGQALLDTTTQHTVETAEGSVTYTARLELDASAQLVQRHYTWAVADREPVEERLQHRLLFPAEIRAHLEDARLEVIDMFDEPAPALGRYSGPRDPRSRALRGRRIHVLARRPLEGDGR